MDLHRRTLLGAAIVAPSVLTGYTDTAAASAEPSRPGQNLTTFMKMRAALDDRLVVGCLRGRYSGVVDGVATPLFGVVSATFSRSRPLAGGGYEIISYEQAYFTDLQTDVALEDWRNPYTNKRLQVPIASQVLSSSVVKPDLTFSPPKGMPGLQFSQFVDAPETMGDEIVFTEHIEAVVAASGSKPAFRYTEASTMRALASEVRASSGRAPCRTSFDAVVSWRPWLEMGSHAGQMMAYGYGLYGSDLAPAPASWIAATRRVKPELLTDPAKVLDPLWLKP